MQDSVNLTIDEEWHDRDIIQLNYPSFPLPLILSYEEKYGVECKILMNLPLTNMFMIFIYWITPSPLYSQLQGKLWGWMLDSVETAFDEEQHDRESW